MAYTTNPKAPRLRAKAVNMVRAGKSISEVARYFGYTKGAVSKWCKKMRLEGSWIIPTLSSCPHHHPNELSEEKVNAIVGFLAMLELVRQGIIDAVQESDGGDIILEKQLQ